MTGTFQTASDKMAIGNNNSALIKTGHFMKNLKHSDQHLDTRNIRTGEKETLKGKTSPLSTGILGIMIDHD